MVPAITGSPQICTEVPCQLNPKTAAFIRCMDLFMEMLLVLEMHAQKF